MLFAQHRQKNCPSRQQPGKPSRTPIKIEATGLINNLAASVVLADFVKPADSVTEIALS